MIYLQVICFSIENFHLGFQLAAFRVTLLRIDAPVFGVGKETPKIVLMDHRCKPDGIIYQVELIAAQSHQHRPARHAADIMVAAFHLVPGIPVVAVIPFPNRFHNGQAFFHKALKNQVGCHLVFYAGPYFIAVYKGQLWTAALRPAAQYQAFFLIQRIGTLDIDMILHRLLQSEWPF